MNTVEDIIPLIHTGLIEDAADVIIEVAAELTQEDANSIMSAARSIDPTESDAAAYIRDAIRDNTELTA